MDLLEAEKTKVINLWLIYGLVGVVNMLGTVISSSEKMDSDTFTKFKEVKDHFLRVFEQENGKHYVPPENPQP